MTYLKKQAQLSFGTVSFKTLRESEISINLDTDVELCGELEKNPQVKIERVNGGTVQYTPSFNVTDRASLAQVLRDQKRGMLLSELKGQAHDGVEKDVAALVRGGAVLAVNDKEVAKTLLMPRHEERFFKVKLPGTVSVSRGCRFARTSTDLRDVVRRGELVFIGEGIDEASTLTPKHNFRVSTASASKLSAAWRPKLSAGFLGKKGVPNTATIPPRIFPFTASLLPLDTVYMGPSATGLNMYRQGFTSLSRRVWDELLEEDSATNNPCVNYVRDEDGTIRSSVEKCDELGLFVLPASNGGPDNDVKDKVLKMAFGATSRARGNLKAKRKRRSNGSGNTKKKGLKVAQDHLKNNPDYSHMIG